VELLGDFASWGIAKVAMTALVPVWFVALTPAFWRRSWLAGVLVINVGIDAGYRRAWREARSQGRTG